MKTTKIGFIGGGNMASSLINGLIASGYSSRQIWVSDINENTLKLLAAKLDINVSSSNDEVIKHVDVVVFAVKPQVLETVAKNAAALIRQQQNLVVSIAAGITQNSLSRWLAAIRRLFAVCPTRLRWC
jgi:pyrroline-5-carboxylate reductase